MNISYGPISFGVKASYKRTGEHYIKTLNNFTFGCKIGSYYLPIPALMIGANNSYSNSKGTYLQW
jgi:hypothetical protein